jgi:hypothetical protein
MTSRDSAPGSIVVDPAEARGASRCPDVGRRGAGNLIVTGRLGKSRQYRLPYCRTCRARFSERKGTLLYRAHLPEDKVAGA